LTASTSATTRCRWRRERKARLHADNVRFLKSDLFAGLQGEHYDLIVTNPPYVTNAETDALPKEYSHEPELGLRAGDDGLDLALRILRDAPLHLSEDGLLICEVGEAERAGQPSAAGAAVGLGRIQGRADGHVRRRMRDLITHHDAHPKLADAAIPRCAGGIRLPPDCSEASAA
jgi:ribosomal protein L3 glutamine methyltransferase